MDSMEFLNTEIERTRSEIKSVTKGETKSETRRQEDQRNKK